MTKKYQLGIIDPLSLISTIFLIISLITATAVVSNPKIKQDIRNWAKEISDSGGGGRQACTPGSQATCTTAANCPGYKICNSSGTGYGITCSDKPNDGCPGGGSSKTTPSPSPTQTTQPVQEDEEPTKTCVPGYYINTTGECRDGHECRTFRNTDCSEIVKCNGLACTTNSSRFNPTPSPSPSPTTIAQPIQQGECSTPDDCPAKTNCTVSVCSGRPRTCRYSCFTPTPSPSPATIAQSDCDKCRKENTYAECKTVCENIGQTIITPTPTSTIAPITNPESAEWHYKCSQGGDFALYIHNKSLGINWDKNQRCKKGCENGKCIEDATINCQKNEISLDKFEKCGENNFWQCIPGQTRRLTLPGQSNIPSVIGCDQNNNTYVISDLSNFQKSLSCDGKNNLINSAKEIISSCANDETCLNTGSYNFIGYSGCYRKDFIDANACQSGNIKEPLPGECKKVCKEKEWVYVNPLECLRDPNIDVQKTCSNDINANVLENGNVVEICPNGCSYGQCVPERLASCSNGDGYLAGNPACLVACVNNHYQDTQICADTIELKGTWNNQDLLLLLKSINEFPETLKNVVLKTTFDRIMQPYMRCANNCADLTSGGYKQSFFSPFLNIVGTIIIPDSGANKYVLDHEIMHGLGDADPQIEKGYIEATGCKQNPAEPNGNYLFSEIPYREYGKTNCGEGLAVSCGEEYMDPQLSCGMQTARPKTYKFCKDSVFNGTEYCQPNVQSSIIKKLMKQIAGFFTVVYAAETLPAATPNSIRTMLGAIIPGATNIKDFESAMGLPKETIQLDDKTIFTYTSIDKSRPHLVYVKDGIVTFVQIVLEKNDKFTLTDIINQYGAFEDKSYSTHSHNALVYSYPSKGISFHIDGNTEQAFMIQKYIPSTKEKFKETVGKNFKDESLGDSFQEVALIKEQLTAKPGNQAIVPTINLPIILIFSTIALISIAAIIFIIFRHKIKNRQ